MNLSTALRIAALVLFVFAAFGFAPFGVNDVALGLACWVASTLP